MNTFILLVITHVNGGAMVSFQEFNSKQNCESAKELFIENSRGYIFTVSCVVK